MILDWNDEKNRWLIKNRNISFEQVELAIEEKRILFEGKHPNKVKYSHQNCFVVDIENYAYFVPYVIRDDVVFLKTIVPSRKFTKKYLLNSKNEKF
ncbi:BrnT family toxin [Candidatus Dojkabacteria bacterium]|nr:BrnT family toxin [Candidatus Dojkabacteria bacterium]